MSNVKHLLVCSQVALLGFVAVPSALAITPAELSGRLARNENVLIIDIRPGTAYGAGHIPGAIHMPASLLPYKALPTAAPIVLCGDGLGVTDESAALAALRARPGVNADVVQGGYAAWLAETRLSTAPSGVTREQMPGITYDQVLKATKGDLVLVDLRAPASSPKTSALAVGVAAAQPDLLQEFAAKAGIPIVGGSAPRSGPSVQALSVDGAGAKSRASSALDRLDGSGRLLVLVADDESEANAAARELRSRGIYRFTILIGGLEAIRHQGKTGSARMTGGDAVKSSQGN